MIRHILRSGEVKTIEGHQITRKHKPRVYEILERGENKHASEEEIDKYFCDAEDGAEHCTGFRTKHKEEWE